jgi:hypothetical protein
MKGSIYSTKKCGLELDNWQLYLKIQNEENAAGGVKRRMQQEAWRGESLVCLLSASLFKDCHCEFSQWLHLTFLSTPAAINHVQTGYWGQLGCIQGAAWPFLLWHGLDTRFLRGSSVWGPNLKTSYSYKQLSVILRKWIVIFRPAPTT